MTLSKPSIDDERAKERNPGHILEDGKEGKPLEERLVVRAGDDPRTVT